MESTLVCDVNYCSNKEPFIEVIKVGIEYAGC